MGRLFLFLIAGLLIIVVISGASLCAAEPAALSPQNASYFLADIQYQIFPAHTNVIIGTNQKIEYVYYTLDNPYRIVIDLIGVIYCDLEQKIEIKDGPIKSISIMEDNSIKETPQGLDKYFYPVDYIIVELNEKYSFDTFYSKDGKVIVAQIQAKLPQAEIAKQPENTRAKLREAAEEPVVIEDVEYEVNPQSSIIAVSADKNFSAVVYEEYNPYRIVLAPEEDTFCELEEKMEPMDGLVKSITINRSSSFKKFNRGGSLFYPVKNIIIEPIMQMPFSLHTADNGKITLVRVENVKASEQIIDTGEQKPQEEKPRPAEKEKILQPKTPEKIQQSVPQHQEQEPFTPQEKQEIVEEITQKLYEKQQDFFAHQEQEEQRRRAIREARDKAKAIRAIEKIGLNELEDLMVKGEGTMGVKYCKGIALSYNENAAIAEEEIKLSTMKVKENFRALFPNAKLKASETSGDVLGGATFIEKLYGIEAEYPVYQGGKLWNAYQQSKVNLNLSRSKYDKVVNDMNYKVSEAYFNVVSAVMNLKLQRELINKVEPILKTAQTRRASGLSTDLEFLNVKSQYNQVQFQLASAERDLSLARVKLEQSMGLDIAKESIEPKEVETDLKFDIISIDLNKCLELAQGYHPDIVVNELLVQSNEYEEKIAKAKDAFKVDLTGFYGRGGSHYKTEADKMDPDWNIGLKVSKPFGGNTASYSFSKEQTQRKVGQTDRQGTQTHSGEFAILDAMGTAAEIKEAQIKRHKAENDLLESRRQVNLEVKESYYNYQEAVIQVKNALEKVRYQKEAVKTANLQAQLNEALQSQQLEAEIKLADERSLYIKALSDYNFSLARLNKAIGVEDYFTLE